MSCSDWKSPLKTWYVFKVWKIKQCFHFYRKLMIFLKLKYRARRWRTAWCFQIFLMGTVCFSLFTMFFTLTFYFQFFSCCTKNYAVSTKNYFKRSYVAQQNYVSHIKIFHSNKKIWHLKERLMLTKYVQCWTEKKYMLKKTVD